MQKQIEFYENKLAFEMDPSDLYDTFEKKENVIAIDTRKQVDYEKERIPSAINIPHREMNEATTNELDKTKIYVCYCDGIGCNASTKGALNMSKLGFKVQELIGGIEWWKYDGYATEGKEATEGSEFNCSC